MTSPIITSDEWLEISRALEEHHALFYQCWGMGRPVFTDRIPTAAVGFNREGEFIEFLFNPDFWKELTPYERVFVIGHECLHVILNHGLRSSDKKDRDRTNRALDIVVNHMLVRSFGFDRDKIRDQDELCWIDTLFPEHNNIPEEESFEYYYGLLPNNPVLKIHVLDDHSKLSGDWSKVIGKLDGELNADEKNAIKSIIEKHCPNQQAGKGNGGGWTFIDVGEVAKKRKWETVIKKWSLKYIRQNSQDTEQWARLARRFNLLPEGLFLPSEMEEDTSEKGRLPVFLFLDTSGSCFHLKERFWKAAVSLPKDRFDTRSFCFDDKVEEVDIKAHEIYGGGGTSFSAIESYILTTMKKDRIDYPEAVFVITDGYGNHVKPQHPARWHWFLTNFNTLNYIPKESKILYLRDYE